MNSRKLLAVLGVAIVILGVGDTFLLLSRHHAPIVTSTHPSTGSGCVTLQIVKNSSGMCVSDAQTMTNFIETNGLTECPFTGGARLTVSGRYDAATQKQVKIVQTWYNCYNHQEGSKLSLITNGYINGATWQALCSYGYKLPSQASSSASPYRQASLAAGKNAGCPSLF